MKRNPLLYIPLLFLAAFAFSALTVHYANFFKKLNRVSSRVETPYSSVDGVILSVTPEGEAAGFKTGDKIIAIGGRTVSSSEIYGKEIAGLSPDEAATFTVGRKTNDNQTQNLEVTFAPQKLDKNFNYYSLQITGFIFKYILPTFSILLGFWVVFVRPQDALA